MLRYKHTNIQSTAFYEMEPLIYIPELKVRQLLNFDAVYEAVKVAFKSVSKEDAIQNSRSITFLPNSQNKMYSMPGCLLDEKFGALGCKIITEFPENANREVPSLMANILVIDETDGRLKAVVAGTEITKWRTAAASAVATRYLHAKDKNILAIIGAGSQGKIHAVAFQHYFSFKEVRIWNRSREKAKQVAQELNNGRKVYVACERIEECVKDADVIVTATNSDKALVKKEWLKNGVHINVVGVNGNNFELDEATYKVAHVYVDSWEGAKNELAALNVEFKGQIGDVIIGITPVPDPKAITVFQSLGMAVEDLAVARLIYDLFTEKKM